MGGIKNRIVSTLRNLSGKSYEHLKYAKSSYSLEGEDRLLFSYLWKIEKGFYVDVGAHHPFKYSNTALFYENGWNGINIEPSPNLFPELVKYRGRDINLNVGVADAGKDASLTFYEFDNPAYNSFDKELAEKREEDGVSKVVSESLIAVKSLRSILDENLPKDQTIDFLNIDVEGLDIQVLKSNNWEKYKPLYILIEDYTALEDYKDAELYVYLNKLGYQLVAKTMFTWFFKLKIINRIF